MKCNKIISTPLYRLRSAACPRNPATRSRGQAAGRREDGEVTMKFWLLLLVVQLYLFFPTVNRDHLGQNDHMLLFDDK